MSDFSGRTPSKLDVELPNNGFLPSLNLGDLQERYRIPSEYRQQTIGSQTIAALIEVNRLLNPKVCEWQRAGYMQLEEVPCAVLGDLHELVELYKVAVFARAKAKLIRQYPSMNRHDRQHYPRNSNFSSQEYSAMEAPEIELEFLNESDGAISLLLGEEPARSLRANVI